MTANEMRISDWSSVACSSDLAEATPMTGGLIPALDEAEGDAPAHAAGSRAGSREGGADRRPRGTARKKAQGPASSKKADESRAKSEGSTRTPGARSKPSRAGKRRSPRRG